MRKTIFFSLMCFLPIACSSGGLPVGSDDQGVVVAGEAGTTEAGAASACESAGGKCVLGNVTCATHAPAAEQDCNPDRNPRRAFCCLTE